MAIKTETFTGGGGGGGGAVDSVNGDTGNVIVTLDGVTDQNAVTTNSVTVGGVTVGTEYSLPTADGTVGQAITTDGNGALSFSTVSSAVTSVNTLTGAVVVSGNDIAADHTASNYTAANANIDGHLSGIDTKLGTLTTGLTYKGSFNATTGAPSIANALQGDLYIISVAGTIYGQTWAVGDHLLINADMGGTVTNSKIDKIDNTDQVTSVNTQTGAVVLSGNDLVADHTASNYTAANANIDGHLSGIDTKFGTLGTASVEDVGTTAGDLVQLDGTAKLPAVDGSQLTNLPSAPVTSVNTLTGAVVVSGDDVAADHTASNYTAANANIDGHLSGIDTKFSTLGTASTQDVGTTANDVVQLDGAAKLPAVDGSQLTNLPSAPVTSVNTLTGAVVVSGSDLVADHTAVNYTAANANIDGHLSGIDTKFGTLGTASTASTSDFLASTAGLDDLSDVAYTPGADIDNYVLTYDHSTTSWGAEAAASGGLSEVVQDTTPQLGGDLDVNGNSITSAGNANVLINPAGTGDISIGADLIPDADVTHTIGDEDNRYISTYSDLNGAIRFKAKNAQGAQITKGQAVYISGVSGTVPEVQLARANSASTMPAFGLVHATANVGADVEIVTFGNLTDYDTTTYSLSANDTVFISAATAGALTNTAPTGETNFIQNIGRVVRADASAGIIKAGGAGRSNATPNLDDGKIFLGNGSNQAVSTALSSIALSSFNDDLSYLSNVVEDTTPQLGGSLDVNGQDIVSVSNGDIEVDPNGTGSFKIRGNATSGSGRIVLNCEQNSHGITLKGPPHSAAASYTLTFPNTDGTADQVLKTDGSGGLDWVDQSGGGGGGGWTYSAITADPANAQASYHYSCSGTFTITLATSGMSAGEEIRIKNMGTGDVTIDPQTSTIDGSTTDYVLDVQYSAITLVSTGTNWEII